MATDCHSNRHDRLDSDRDYDHDGNLYGIITKLSVTKDNKIVTANVITADVVTDTEFTLTIL